MKDLKKIWMPFSDRVMLENLHNKMKGHSAGVIFKIERFARRSGWFVRKSLEQMFAGPVVRRESRSRLVDQTSKARSIGWAAISMTRNAQTRRLTSSSNAILIGFQFTNSLERRGESVELELQHLVPPNYGFSTFLTKSIPPRINWSKKKKSILVNSNANTTKNDPCATVDRENKLW